MAADKTLCCSFCGHRKPRTGFQLLAGRRFHCCPKCWETIEAYVLALDDLRDEREERDLRFMTRVLHSCLHRGLAMVPPAQIVALLRAINPPV